MSKKVSFPVMSLTLTGVLFILGLLVLTLKPFLFGYLYVSGAVSTAFLIKGLFGFLGAFIMFWALTSICLHPDIDDSNVKAVFITFTALFIIAVFTNAFGITMALL